MNSIGFIGAGNITSAIIPSLLSSYFCSPHDVYVYDIDTSKTTILKKEYSVIVSPNIKHLLQQVNIVVIAVKPHAMTPVLDEFKDVIHDHILISTAAGISIQTILQTLKTKVKIVRIMPNIGAVVQLSMTAYTAQNLSHKEEQTIQQFLLTFGKYTNLKEDLFDSFTSICGSSPAFFVDIIRPMVEYAVAVGFDETQARYMIAQTMNATSNLLIKQAYTEQEFIQKVATKGGTTEAGLSVFLEHDIHKIITTALEHSTERSKQLNQQ